MVTPAAIHKISSGKAGNNIIKKKAYFPFVSFFVHLSASCLPQIQTRIFLPNFLPSQKAKKLPINIDIKLKINARSGPNIKAPAIVVIKAGIGRIVTCKN